MTKDRNSENNQGSKSMAGGFFIALCTLIGFFIGAFNGQVSLGAIGGIVVGIAIAIVIWLNDVKKRQE